MSNVTISVEVKGVRELAAKSAALRQFLAVREIARVYSRGAVNPRTGQDYSRYVGAAQWQARIHAGRWHTDQEAADKFSPAVADAVAQAVEAVLAGSNPTAAIRAVVEQILSYITEQPPPTPVYIRTGRYVASWAYEVHV